MTGGDLHESKGTAAAAVDTVFVADGAGSGVYKKVPGAALAGLGNPFGAQLLHVREQQTPGVPSATATTASAWTTTVLNATLTAEIAGASLGSNQITLPAGVYFIDATIPWSVGVSVTNQFFIPRLWNFTTSSQVVLGSSARLSSNTTVGLQTMTVLKGRFTLTGTSALILQHWKSYAQVPDGISGPGTTEVYANVLIWKIS